MTWTHQDLIVQTAENPADIGNLLNRYFYSLFNHDDPNDEDSIPISSEDNSTLLETISDITLTEAEVCSVLRTINENKATRPDKIPAVLLKNSATNISPSLCDLFNKSLSSGLLPKEWKLSNICPIPKKSPHHEVSNYRPISLLSLVSKVFERCIYNRLADHFSGQLYKLQYGFQKDKSTTSQLLNVLHNIHKFLEKRCEVDTIYLDFAKAFNKVSHEHLLVKLHNFGIGGNLLRWFGDYLSGRYQRVTVMGITSEPLPALSGVHQGSILGPLLFLVYVNNLPKSTSNNTIVTMFADDTKCHRALQHPDDNKILQSDLDKITVWCHDWKMSLNQSKCGVVHFSRSQQPKPLQYTLLGKPIKPTCSQKYLGIITTSDLKWKKQILEMSSKANRMLGCVKRTASAIHDVSVRKALYMTMVRNQLAYCCQVWAPQSVNNISTIERVQRCATKFILSLPYNTNMSYKERLVTIGIIPICYWHEYLDMVYLFKCIITNSDSNINIKKHVRETRTSTQGVLLDVSKCKTAAFQNSYYIRAANVWNTLPCCIRNTNKTLVSFKASLKRHYKDLTSLVYNPEDPRTFKSVCV